ncbi:hypothetical protein N9924_00790 [bacterium]|nr:hypothetical protein [bacterium]
MFSLVIYEDDEIELRYEKGEDDNFLFLHIVFNHLNRKILRELHFRLEWAKELASFMGYSELYTYTQNIKAAKLSKDIIYCNPVTVEGQVFEVYKWELK